MFNSIVLLLTLYVFAFEYLSAGPTDCSTPDGRLGKCLTKIRSCKTVEKSNQLSKCDNRHYCCPKDKSPPVFPREVKDCGFSRDLLYIIGGEDAIPHSLPWVAALVFKDTGNFYCGASLISNSYVLTAAHCILFNDGPVNPSDIAVKLGSQQITKDGALYDVEKVIPHENYRPWRYYNDIALLKLSQKIEFNDNVVPICLPSKEMVSNKYIGQSMKLAGWGTTSYEGSTSEILQTTNVPVVSNQECYQNYSTLEDFEFAFPEGINENFICAGFPEGGRDTCQGDSGGPMMLFGNTTYPTYQIGVVSFGNECAKPGFPGVYTSTLHHLGWIGSRMQMNES